MHRKYQAESQGSVEVGDGWISTDIDLPTPMVCQELNRQLYLQFPGVIDPVIKGHPDIKFFLFVITQSDHVNPIQPDIKEKPVTGPFKLHPILNAAGYHVLEVI